MYACAHVCMCVTRSHDAGSVSSRSELGRSRPSSSSSSSCWAFLRRALWVALPIQLFLLLLLVAVAYLLVPMTDEDYTCSQCNNFASSFYPMLSYTNGPPPV